MRKQYIIFGTGKNGMELYNHLEKKEVAFFCDNNPQKAGGKLEGIEIISFERLLEIHDDYRIILSVGDKFYVRKQLEKNGISEYIEYQDDDAKNDMIANDSLQIVMKPGSSMDRLLDSYVALCSNINTLNDFSGFKELVLDLKKELNGEFARYESARESMLYGHGKSLMDYAKIKADYVNFPDVAHAPFFAGTHRDFDSAAIFGNLYDKKIHNQRYPYIPVFSVGPYIQYAQSIYSEKDLLRIKKHNGKTAVFFITHSVEQDFVAYDEEKILKQITEIYAKQYDTIYACAYWHDIDKDIYNELYKNGIKVVSAGFRFDLKFIQRLRTIMELSDDIFIYGFTSAIVYAMSLKKNLHVIDCDEVFDTQNMPSYIPVDRIEGTEEYRRLLNIFFRKPEYRPIHLSKEEQNIVDLYFGLEQFRTPEEIRMIYDVCCDIWDNCEHLLKDYPIGVYKTYQQYQKEYNFEKLSVLSESLGRGFWNL